MCNARPLIQRLAIQAQQLIRLNLTAKVRPFVSMNASVCTVLESTALVFT